MLIAFTNVGIRLNGRTSGQTKTTCPRCSQSRKHPNDPCLSVNIDEGIWHCHNCQWAGTVKQKAVPKKEYKTPEINRTAVSDSWVSWFKGRGISKATIMHFGITESQEYSAAAGKEVSCVNFNYYRDEKLVNIKFRGPDKQFKMSAGAELILYGMDAVKDKDSIVICEGEVDALSMYESGIFNAVSVPNGASLGNNKLEYLDNTWQLFENKQKIILATDNDQPGRALMEALAQRFGKDRCYIVDYPDGCKDANDVLLLYGKDILSRLVESARMYPLDGITTLEGIEERLDYLYKFGSDRGLKIGFETFDNHMSWKKGEFTIVTGVPGSGKSEFIDQIMLKLSEIHDWKWGVFSAENQPEEQHLKKMAEKFIGKPCFASLPNSMNEDEYFSAKVFLSEHMYFVSVAENNLTLDGILEKIKQLVLRYGIQGFVIDPWNYIEHAIPRGYTETQYISEALTKVSRFVKNHNVHGIIVAHPTKIKKNEATGKYNVATLYDCAGSANFFNKADNGLSVYRHFDTGIVEVYIQKIRHKYIGKLGYVSFSWDYASGRYSETVHQNTY